MKLKIVLLLTYIVTVTGNTGPSDLKSKSWVLFEIKTFLNQIKNLIFQLVFCVIRTMGCTWFRSFTRQISCMAIGDRKCTRYMHIKGCRIDDNFSGKIRPSTIANNENHCSQIVPIFPLKLSSILWNTSIKKKICFFFNETKKILYNLSYTLREKFGFNFRK